MSGNGIQAPSERDPDKRMDSCFTHGSSPASASENENGVSLFASTSPRGQGLTFLDYFDPIRYYDVLGGRFMASARSSPIQEYADEYQEMNFVTGDVGDIFGARSSALTGARLRSFESLRAATSSRLQKLRGRLRPANYLPKRWTPQHMLLRDKLSFVLGVTHIVTSAFWIGRSPSTFYQLYTVKAALLFCIRFITYRRDKMHYYLFDFCYYANILLIIHAWLLPEWCLLEKILFAYATGPLAWTIVAFRNSMIFHSVDKMTSVFMHIFPMLVVWTQRWYPGDAKHWKTIASKSCESHNATVWELVVIPWIPYAVWAVAYYLKVFVISSKRIQDRGYHTLYKYVIRKPDSLMGRVNSMLPRAIAPLVYMLWHVLFCAATFMVAMVCWYQYWVHTAFCCCVIFASIWNGGSYYFDVFAHSYLADTGLPAKARREGAQTAAAAEVSVSAAQEAAAALDSGRARSEGDMSALRADLEAAVLGAATLSAGQGAQQDHAGDVGAKKVA